MHISGPWPLKFRENQCPVCKLNALGSMQSQCVSEIFEGFFFDGNQVSYAIMSLVSISGLCKNRGYTVVQWELITF